MTSRITADFRKRFQRLPPDIQKQAQRSYRLWKKNPQYAGLDYKRVSQTIPLYSVRIGLHWRALALKDGDTVDWFWLVRTLNMTNCWTSWAKEKCGRKEAQMPDNLFDTVEEALADLQAAK